MKKLILIFVVLAMPLLVIGQENSKQKEVGLIFSSLDNFGLTFRMGDTKSVWRFNALALTGNNQNEISYSSEYKVRNLGVSFRIGKECRKALVENLELRYGVDLSFGYSNYETSLDDKTINNFDMNIKRKTYEPGFNFVFGLNYVIKNQFVIGAELLPSFSYIGGTQNQYNNGTNVKADISGFRYGLSNTSAVVSLLYRF